MPGGRQSRPGSRKLGQRVRAKREELGLPRTIVCERADLSLEALRMLEAGDGMPYLDTVMRVGRVLDMSVVELFPNMAEFDRPKRSPQKAQRRP